MDTHSTDRTADEAVPVVFVHGRGSTADFAPPASDGRRQPGDPVRDVERGFTVAELAVALMIISILAVIALGMLNGRIEKARLARCMIDLRSVQSTVWSVSDGVSWPNQYSFWQDVWSGKRPGPYFYLTDAEDKNCGHGNDLDGFDEQNPGNSKREERDLKFVVLCQHDHGILANYVYIEDEGPPMLAGWAGKDNPRYDHFIKDLDKPPK